MSADPPAWLSWPAASLGVSAPLSRQMGMDTSEHVPIGQVLISPGDACPRDKLGRPRSLFRAGDVLRVACPFAEAEVTEVDRYHVTVRWPWGQIDPSSSYLWNGEVALEFGTDSWWPFETRPGLERLRPGDRCLLGIPVRVVHVFAVRCWWPDQDTGQLPRRPLALYVFRQGTPHDLGQPEYELAPTRARRSGWSCWVGHTRGLRTWTRSPTGIGDAGSSAAHTGGSS